MGLLPTFPDAYANQPHFVKGFESYLLTDAGERYLDLTCGGTSFSLLGWGNNLITSRIEEQLRLLPHSDYKSSRSKLREDLADLIIRSQSTDLSHVFFSGGSGSEACEMALHMSYQAHCENGQASKRITISRLQSYHGATMGSMTIGERPNLEFFRPLQPTHNHAFIEEHNPFKHRKSGESADDYAKRSALMLETKILDLGPENVGCFVVETMLGGLVGDVPALKGYFSKIREICDKYDVHLILDEVWCGFGVTGKYFCCEWDEISPDFLFGGKALSCGYIPLSCVLTTQKIVDCFANGSGRIETSCTYQGHLAACAGALAVQEIVTSNGFLQHVDDLGSIIRDYIQSELSSYEIFANVRGRGVRNSIEVRGIDTNKFTTSLSQQLKESGILVSGKWHRISILPAMNIDKAVLLAALDMITKTFKRLASDWTDDIEVVIPERF